MHSLLVGKMVQPSFLPPPPEKIKINKWNFGASFNMTEKRILDSCIFASWMRLSFMDPPFFHRFLCCAQSIGKRRQKLHWAFPNQNKWLWFFFFFVENYQFPSICNYALGGAGDQRKEYVLYTDKNDAKKGKKEILWISCFVPKVHLTHRQV